jgi:hypothetical protein
MNRKTQRLLDELKGAINQALMGSDRFAQVLEELKRTGQSVVVSVDAALDQVDDSICCQEQHIERVPLKQGFSSEDRKYLREMKITLGE